MIPKVDGAPPTGKYEDPDLYFPLFTALQVNISKMNQKLKSLFCAGSHRHYYYRKEIDRKRKHN